MTNEKLVFVDVESTGTNTATDKIWQVSIWHQDGLLDHYINPGIPVPKEVLELTGQPNLNEFLKDKPLFRDVADEILAYLNKGILCGFGIINFDVPILFEELYRCGKVWMVHNIPLIDACIIFKKKEPRDLKAAVRFYCDKELVGGHDAHNDVTATSDVLMAQLQRYPDLNALSFGKLAEFCRSDDRRVDLAGKLVFNADGVPCYNIGNEKGVPVLDKPQFGEWVLKRDFPEQTKMVLRDILRKKDTKQKELL